MKALFLILLFIGCSNIKTISRLEYGNNIAFVENNNISNRSLSLVAGPRIQIEKCNVDLMCGPQIFENKSSWTNIEQSIDINPRIMYFFNQATFIHLELDYSLIYSNNTENAFILMAWEKEW